MKYEIELWSKNGVLLADVSKLVRNFSFSLERNEAEQVEIQLDLNSYEDLCADIGASPTSILSPYQTDIKVKRNGEYLFGAHVGQVETVLGETSASISIRAFGYLNLLIDRYITASYTQNDAVDIAWDLIALTQAQTNGDLGISMGTMVETVARDRTYVRQNVKEAIVNLTKLVNGNFDFEFTADRVFNTYTAIGSNRSADLEFIYPGNIKQVGVPRDGLSLFNKIYGLGSGFGADQLTSTQSDNDSQLNYGVHEKIQTFNSVVEQDTLDQNTAGFLNLKKNILEIPQMTVNGEDFSLNQFGIGDSVTVRIEQHPFLATIDGVYRIERIDVNVDENEAEDIRLYFDNLNIDEVIEEQPVAEPVVEEPAEDGDES